MEKQEINTVRKVSQWLKKSLFIKLLAIGFLVILLLIPNSMIQDLIRERQYNQQDAQREVSQSWGAAQTVTGPILTVPYTEVVKYDNGTITELKHYAHFLPESLKVNGELEPETLRRGMFEVILYQAEVILSGDFKKPDFATLHIDESQVHWEEAKVSIGITGMSGIKEIVKFDWAGTPRRMEAGTSILPSGISIGVGILPEQENYAFSIPLKLNGSQHFHLVPVGKETTVNLKSKWHSPSFDGQFLPDEREVTKDGFSATWQILDFNRNFPQQWVDDAQKFGQSSFGVRLIQPVDEYSKNTRSAKYALLVIGLTFLIYFFFETLKKFDIHPFQYFLIGLALSIFYLLLLSLSEQIGFNYAYLAASVATVGLITVYSSGFLKNKALTIQLGLLLAVIYGFIFVVLQMEDFALLAGSIGIFVALAAVMFYSRKVDWYSLGE